MSNINIVIQYWSDFNSKKLLTNMSVCTCMVLVFAPSVTCDTVQRTSVFPWLEIPLYPLPPSRKAQSLTLATEVYVEDSEQHGGGAVPER